METYLLAGQMYDDYPVGSSKFWCNEIDPHYCYLFYENDISTINVQFHVSLLATKQQRCHVIFQHFGDATLHKYVLLFMNVLVFIFLYQLRT